MVDFARRFPEPDNYGSEESEVDRALRQSAAALNEAAWTLQEATEALVEANRREEARMVADMESDLRRLQARQLSPGEIVALLSLIPWIVILLIVVSRY